MLLLLLQEDQACLYAAAAERRPDSLLATNYVCPAACSWEKARLLLAATSSWEARLLLACC